mmetsp:Transcript_9222/g.8154  ORF Transcript_9222/g.8154 Transcript_9222/m.8154 type:complete len:186 (+) Transcript_9222:280-837(+)
MVSTRTRVLLRMIAKGTKASEEDYKRLFVMNRKHFEEEMKDPKYGDIDRMHYIMQSDPSKMMHTRKVEYELLEFKEIFQQEVHDLIKLRNRIFNTQQRFQKIDNPKRAGLEPRNVAKFIELSKELEDKEDYSVYSLYNIVKKSPHPAGKPAHSVSTYNTESYDTECIALTDTDLDNEDKKNEDKA